MDTYKQMPTMSQEDFDLAVNSVTSFYQSKRALLKKQVTHWMGKFAIVKHENNVLRNKIRRLADAGADKDVKIILKGEEIGRLNTRIAGLEAMLTTVRTDYKKAVSIYDAEVAPLKARIVQLESQVQELEAGALI
jgi:hypothetical protein